MTIDTRHALHPLALAMTLALAACGGNQDAPQTDAAGPQTKADTGLAATTLDTATTDASATPQTSSSALATKEVATADTPPISENGKKVRGDVLIQALLSRTARHDAQNNVQTAWLSPESVSGGALGGEGRRGTSPFVSPVVLANQDIRATDAETASLGRYYYQFEISQGPGRGARDAARTLVPSQTLRFGLSSAGLPNGGTGAAQAAAGALEIGTQAQVQRTSPVADQDRYAPPSTTRNTLAAKQVTTLQPNEVYYLDSWKHEWERSGADYFQASVFGKTDDNANRFSTCAQVVPVYTRFETLCDVWEVPTGWKAGQPLTHVTQTFRTTEHYETAGSYNEWNWSNQKAPQYVVADSLKTTTQAVDDRGVSGALLAAMLDAWTPRAKGMQHLPAYATVSKAAGDKPISGVDPQRISFHHDSRASAYADGSTDTNTYSPTAGDYLYVFSTGAWLSEQVPNTRSQAYPQNTLAIHVNASAQRLTLPRWAGLNIRGRDWQLKASQLYEGEPLSGSNTSRTIAANELIMFGIPVQAWYGEGWNASSDRDAQIQLTVQQSQANPRSVDLCWGTSLWFLHVGQYCTTFTVPEGWTAGQPLLPQSYYAEAGSFPGGSVSTWTTQAAGN